MGATGTSASAAFRAVVTKQRWRPCLGEGSLPRSRIRLRDDKRGVEQHFQVLRRPFRYRDGGRSTKYDRIRLRAVRTSLPEEPPAMTLTRSVFRFVESRFRGEIVNSTRVITSRRRVTADQRRSRRLEGLALVPGTTTTGQAATGPGLRRSGGVWPLSRSPALSPGGGRNRVRSVG